MGVRKMGPAGEVAFLLAFFLLNISDTGWRLEWGDEESLPKSGVLTSPNYPDLYPNNHDSTQTIQVAEGMTIRFALTNFNTHGSRSAIFFEGENDYVEIVDEDGTVLLPKIWGSRLSYNYYEFKTSNSNIMHVKFRTNGDTQVTGWRLEWTEYDKLAPILLYRGDGYAYYKVPVLPGTHLTEGAVASTCERVNMTAVCAGDSSCRYTDTSKCMVTPLSSECDRIMAPLSKTICPDDPLAAPSKCPPLDGLFSYRKGSRGECGIVDRIWCARGDERISEGPIFTWARAMRGRSKPRYPGYQLLFGYCAKMIKG